MIETKHTHTTDNDFVTLTRQLDSELNERYGKAQKDYDALNRIERIDTAVVGYENDRPVACGCFKPFDGHTVEIKRMFVKKEYRCCGFASKLLNALEIMAKDHGFSRTVLETGKGQPEAIALYTKCGYRPIENFGPYQGVENSVCMEKVFTP